MHVNEKEISAYLDNSLPGGKQEQLKEHFAACAQCRSKLNEWESLFDTIGMLSFDFTLEGLEERVLQRIRNEGSEAVSPRILVTNMAYAMVFLFVAGLFISPVTHIAGQLLRTAGNYATGAGISFINQIKWHAVDLVSYLQGAKISDWLFLLVAGVTLIAGGTYFSLGSRLRKTQS